MALKKVWAWVEYWVPVVVLFPVVLWLYVIAPRLTSTPKRFEQDQLKENKMVKAWGKYRNNDGTWSDGSNNPQ